VGISISIEQAADGRQQQHRTDRLTPYPPSTDVQMTLTSTHRTMILITQVKNPMTIAPQSHPKFFADKILPLTFSPNPTISIDRGGGGVPQSKPRFPFHKTAIFLASFTFTLLSFANLAAAQAQRGTLVHEESIRVSPSADAAKLGEVGRGHELVIIDSSRDWTHVEAILREPRKDADEDDPESEGKTITGWVSSKAMVNLSTPNGDKIVFGEAADSEDQASRRRGRRDAAQDAMRLYYRVFDLFPTSSLAAEALYRAADIRWQVERSDVLTRPSARERDSYMRGQIDEEWMKLVMKKFPGTKWADLAAFHLIENKLCGDWQAASKCPDKEADMYEKYAKEHEQSPTAPEALYDAAWRRSALIEIYKNEANQKKADEAKSRALALAQKIVSQYAQSDWSPRAQMLIFYVQQGVPTYGNAGD
jgi:outer membrane protein assembly factor BamD (BamD/ComL family)